MPKEASRSYPALAPVGVDGILRSRPRECFMFLPHCSTTSPSNLSGCEDISFIIFSARSLARRVVLSIFLLLELHAETLNHSICQSCLTGFGLAFIGLEG